LTCDADDAAETVDNFAPLEVDVDAAAADGDVMKIDDANKMDELWPM
jgi:hypothetical protein